MNYNEKKTPKAGGVLIDRKEKSRKKKSRQKNISKKKLAKCQFRNPKSQSAKSRKKVAKIWGCGCAWRVGDQSQLHHTHIHTLLSFL